MIATTLLLAQADALAPMADRQRGVALLLAAVVIGVVFELLRRRKLREEYSWVWVVTAVALAVLAAQQGLLLTFSQWIGSSSPVSTLFFGALLFLFALVLQFSVRLSRLTHRHRTLGQRMALLEAEVRRLRETAGHDSTPMTEPGERTTAPRPHEEEVA